MVHRVYQSSGQGIPLGATANFNKYKIILLDVGLAQSLLGLNISEWFLGNHSVFINKGLLVESFVGQELLVYLQPQFGHALYYWQRDAKGSEAELDYLIQLQGQIIPIEVKSDRGSHLRSMHIFLKSHQNSTFGIRFSLHNYSIYQNIHSYPLYAIAAAVKWDIAL